MIRWSRPARWGAWVILGFFVVRGYATVDAALAWLLLGGSLVLLGVADYESGVEELRAESEAAQRRFLEGS